MSATAPSCIQAWRHAMPNFADFGLMSQGANQSTMDSQRAALSGQQVESGQIGLEESKRQRDVSAKYRSAVSSARPEEGRAGVYHRISKEALASGDADTYTRAQEASKKLQDEGWGNLSMRAITGAPVEDAEKEFNNLGVGRIVPGTLEYGKDPKSGDIIVRASSVADGKPYSFNATQYARMHGIIKPTVHSIPAGGSLAITEPGSPTQVVGGRDKAFSPSQSVIHVERNVDGEKKTYAYDMEKKDWIGGAPPGEAGAPPEAETGAHVRKNLPVLKEVSHAVAMIPGAVNRMDLSDPLHPYYEWTEKGQKLSSRAQRLYLANPSLAPEVIREIVAAPDLQARIVDGEEAEVRYKGKTYKLGSGTAVAQAPSGPSAAPGAVPAASPAGEPKPAPKAEPKPAPKKEEPKAKPKTQEASDDDIPDVAEPKGAGSPKERHQSRVAAELAKSKAAAEAKKANKPVETFRAIASSPTMSRDDLPLIQEAIDSGKLTAAEELKAHRMLAKLRPTVAGR